MLNDATIRVQTMLSVRRKTILFEFHPLVGTHNPKLLLFYILVSLLHFLNVIDIKRHELWHILSHLTWSYQIIIFLSDDL